ncbi:MAG: hypothetical protein U0L84_03375 [Acutalibacteraceae bacterium]|nr:hypothetical protein [Acutalibacteraceae bacterium]
MLATLRIIFKILLFISVVITIETIAMFFSQFRITDGIEVYSSLITLTLFGDWPHSTHELLRYFLHSSIFLSSSLLGCTVLDIIAIVKNPRAKKEMNECKVDSTRNE